MGTPGTWMREVGRVTVGRTLLIQSLMPRGFQGAQPALDPVGCGRSRGLSTRKAGIPSGPHLFSHLFTYPHIHLVSLPPPTCPESFLK